MSDSRMQSAYTGNSSRALHRGGATPHGDKATSAGRPTSLAFGSAFASRQLGSGLPELALAAAPAGQAHPQQEPVRAVIMERSYYNNGKAGDHAKNVMSVYLRHNPGSLTHTRFTGLGHDEPRRKNESNDTPPRLKTVDDMNAYVDAMSSNMLKNVSQRLEGIVDHSQERVVNMSIGFTRANVYEATARALVRNPHLAPAFGLDSRQVRRSPKQLDRMPDALKNQVVKYVDRRMDTPQSEFNTALGQYRQVAQRAAENGIHFVAATANEGDMRQVFPGAKTGMDTNFLALSDHVISVAATDNQGTPADPSDDQVADFSSRGTGRYNPTIAYTGVNVPLRSRTGNGTSYAAPAVSGTIARMLTENPQLSFAQVKRILQDTAHDIEPGQLADGHGVMQPRQAIAQAQATPGHLH